MTSANNEKGEGYQPMGKYLYPLLFLSCIVSFVDIWFMEGWSGGGGCMIGIKGASYRQGKGGKRKRGEEKLQHILTHF